jgi:hypothetical protein
LTVEIPLCQRAPHAKIAWFRIRGTADSPARPFY